WAPVQQPQQGTAAAAPSFITVGRIVAAVGGFLVLVSSWLDWFGDFGGYSAHQFPLHFLINNRSGPGQGGLSLGLIVVLLGLAGIALSLIPVANPGPIVIGAIVGLISVVYLYQLYTLVDEVGGSTEFGDVLAIGPFLAGVGGLLLIAGGVLNWLTRKHAPTAATASPQGPAPDARPW
ncbi:MAG: hypothetical protein ACXV9P_07700, partial [Acidimicrobiia bacterium]